MKRVIMGRLSVMLTVVDDDDDAAIPASHFANQLERVDVVTFQRRALLC